jgi:hypothetical protein
MSVRLVGRYEPGSPKDRAHRLLTESEVAVDQVWGVEEVETGVEAITFTANGKALTAFASGAAIIRVDDGWDVPRPDSGIVG